MSIDTSDIGDAGSGIVPHENEILADLMLGKKSSLVTLTRSHSSQFGTLEYIFFIVLPRPRPHEFRIREIDLKAIDEGKLSASQQASFEKLGLVDSRGFPTQRLISHIASHTPAFEKPLSHKHVPLFNMVMKNRSHWHDEVLKDGLVSYRRAIGVMQAGWFDARGTLSSKAHAFLELQRDADFKWLSSKITSQHISLLNLLATYGNRLNKDLYAQSSQSKVPWEKQLQAIQWLREKGVLNAELKPTAIAHSLRCLKTPKITEKELVELDVRIEEFLRLGSSHTDHARLGLSKIPRHEFESRLFRLKLSGFVTEENQATERFLSAAATLREKYQRTMSPPWLLEKRSPRLSELTETQRLVLFTLATESPYLTQQQLMHHFSISKSELSHLKKGRLLNQKSRYVDGKNDPYLALNNQKLKQLFKEIGIEKPLNGKFQRASHLNHDLMLWESLQDFRRTMLRRGDPIVAVVHERAVYQAKTSPNDNKGITTPDLILKTKSGAVIAFEYGNYKPPKMIQKIENFPQENVVIYTSDAQLLDQYRELYFQTPTHQQSLKSLTWNFIPEISL